jgi:hypothetical protein
VKLDRKLPIYLGILLFALHPLFSQVNFPARGFASILDDSQAQEKLDAYKEVFFRPAQKVIYHQAYIYRFQFTHFPSSGKPIIHHGMLSGPCPNSSILRIDFVPARQESSPSSSFLLFREEINPRVWRWENKNPIVTSLSQSEWLVPWKSGINHTPFDLLMPFVNWPFQYEKSGRVCGRSAHLFLFSPPNHFSAFIDNSRSIRLAIDHAYDAPLRIEYLDGGILPARVLSLQSFKKIDQHWVVKAIDAKDRDSGSRTRMELQSYAHGLDLPSTLFDQSGLNLSIHLAPVVFQSI